MNPLRSLRHPAHYAPPKLILALLLAVSTCASALAEPCLDYRGPDPAIMFEAGGLDGTSVATADGNAYVRQGTAVVVYDISTPAAATVVGQADLTGTIYQLAVIDGYLYARDSTAGLRYAAIGADGLPGAFASLPLPNGARDLAVDGNLLYVAAGSAGLGIIDVGDPGAPAIISMTPAAAAVSHVALSGDVAYCGLFDGRVQPIEITNPAAPVAAPAVASAPYLWSLAVHDGLLVAGHDDNRLYVFALDVPLAPELVGVCDLPDPAGHAFDRDGTLWVAGIYGTLMAMDVTDPSAPAVARMVELSGLCYDVSAAADFLGVAGTGGLRVVDLSQPASGHTLGWHRAPHGFEAVAVSGDRAYGLDYFDGLVTLDVSDPAQPVELARLPLAGDLGAIRLVGDHAFIAANWSGVHVIDLSDPDRPALAMTIPRLTDRISDVQVLGASLVTLAERDSRVYDVSDWHSPQLLATVGGYPIGGVATGSLVVAESSSQNLEVIDFAQPSLPVVRATYTGFTNPVGLAAAGNLVYSVDLAGRFVVLDITAPDQPTLVGECQLGYYCSAVCVLGDVAYVSNDRLGLVAVDVSSPAQPRVIGNRAFAGAIVEVTSANGLLYACTYDGGLAIAPPDCGATAAAAPTPTVANLRLLASPNPFNPRTTLTFELAEPGRASVDVFDLSGRHVRTLAREVSLAAGPQGLPWDGRDDGGQALPAGLYVARLRVGPEDVGLKLTLLK